MFTITPPYPIPYQKNTTIHSLTMLKLPESKTDPSFILNNCIPLTPSEAKLLIIHIICSAPINTLTPEASKVRHYIYKEQNCYKEQYFDFCPPELIDDELEYKIILVNDGILLTETYTNMTYLIKEIFT